MPTLSFATIAKVTKFVNKHGSNYDEQASPKNGSEICFTTFGIGDFTIAITVTLTESAIQVDSYPEKEGEEAVTRIIFDNYADFLEYVTDLE